MERMDIRNKEELLCEVSKGQRFKYHLFWGHSAKTAGVIDKSCLSNWFPATFVIDEIEYSTAEHYMMAEKARLFGDSKTLSKILVAKSPGAAKRFGREVQGFDEQLWNEACMEIVVRGNLAKFSQHESLSSYLLKTGDKIIVEASPVDRIWGIGLAQDHEDATRPQKWRGQNLLGFALMEVRSMLMS